ncbi:DUF6932 family protein [Runella aurantiaca]|uniref:Polymerase nucleotidyl transferase domain-containing protein n=1 Tax=Runella aurantiaca TaxID=2282308 RepID=A0A369ICW2_9BACT|nr:hypothetical protein [Runella aurantiaca]RDB07498.1 hypothetical protein DVG78_00050 [Runella aurantiaca]
MSITFDPNGHLVSYDIVSIDTYQLEEYFIFNEHRLNIYRSFKKFIHSVKALGLSEFDIWIDGSFATLKTRPNDIDVVCFVNHYTYDSHYKALGSLRIAFPQVDAYFVKLYPLGHLNYNFSKFNELDWYHLLTKDRKRRSKGILKMKISKDDK